MTWLRYLHKLIPHQQKLNDETINDSNYVLSSLLTSTSSELVQLKRVNIIRRQQQQQQQLNQNRCHQGRVVKRGATNFKQIDAGCVRRRVSSHVVVNGHRNCVLTAEKFTKIKNPIITINKNSFRTNNHFSHQSIGKKIGLNSFYLIHIFEYNNPLKVNYFNR